MALRRRKLEQGTTGGPVSIFLGNAAPVAPHGGAHAVVHRDGEAPIFRGNVTDDAHDPIVLRTPEGQRDDVALAVRPLGEAPEITTIVREANVRPGASADEVIANHLYAVRATWGTQSTQPPMWVACDDHVLASAIAEEFGCPVLPADLGALAAGLREEWERVRGRIQGPTALMVNGGRDATFDAVFSTAGYTYIGLTATSTAPSASDTTLTGQITTAGGGLIAASATYAHTSGTSTATLTKTFTANVSDSLPVTIAQVGLRNASGTGGTFHSRTLLSSTATLSASGDALTVTWTFTLTPS